MAGGLPSGTVTFLFTDIEGSTRLWEDHTVEMRGALARHDQILRSVIEDRGGYVFSTAGDAFSSAFARVRDALDAAIEAQTQLVGTAWPPHAEIRVRMGLHTGEAQERNGDYFGPAVNRAARVMSVARGAQVLMSGITSELLADDRAVRPVDLGEHWLKGLRRRERLFDVPYAGRPDEDFASLVGGASAGVLVGDVHLVGREREVGELGALLEDHRVVSLVGAGGIGKTSLATAVAAERADRFVDGVRMVELAGLESGESVAAAVANALGVRPRADMSMTESIAESYRDLASLVVLDNCEHVLDDAARLVAALWAGTRHLRVLATSREPLSIGGECAVVTRRQVEHLAGVDGLDRPVGAPRAARQRIASAADSALWGSSWWPGLTAKLRSKCERTAGQRCDPVHSRTRP